MENVIYGFFVTTLSVLKMDFFTLLFIVVETIVCICLFVLKFFSKIKNSTFFALIIPITLLISFIYTFTVCSTLSSVKNIIFYCGLYFFWTLFEVVFFIKINKEIRQEKGLDEFIDQEIAKPLSDNFRVEKISVKPQVEEPKSCCGVDFTHVKNVLNRLEYLNLSPTEKKQIRNIKETVYFAEKEGAEYLDKRKINDGLSDLLKIMSRYGV